MSVLDRLEEIRLKEGFNKAQFEKTIGKSSGYLKILKDKGGVPGSDVLIRISENFRNYDMNWLLTGEGQMWKEAADPEEKKHEAAEEKTSYPDLLTVRNEIRSDLKIILNGMTENFRVINDGIFHGLRNDEKILGFIEDLDQVKIAETAKWLDEFLKAKR